MEPLALGGRRRLIPGTGSCVVLVCGHGPCAAAAEASLSALKPLVARSHRALLVRSGCHHPHDRCHPAPGTASVTLQHCSADLRPRGRARSLCEPASPTYRCVEHWLDGRD